MGRESKRVATLTETSKPSTSSRKSVALPQRSQSLGNALDSPTSSSKLDSFAKRATKRASKVRRGTTLDEADHALGKAELADGSAKPRVLGGVTPRSKEGLSEFAASTALGQEMTDILSIMQSGSPLVKVRPKKIYPRTYFLSDDLTSIRWEPSKKKFKESKMLVADIREVVIGQSTEAFRECVEPVADKNELSFTVFFNNDTEPLDLFAEDVTHFDAWTKGLVHLISAFNTSLTAMKSGTQMMKVRPKKHYQRTFLLSEDLTYITWLPTKKPLESRIYLADVKFIRQGQNTVAFHKAKWNHLEHLSFSLIYGDNFETLDLIAENIADYKNWTTGLQHLVTGFSDSLSVMLSGSYFTLARRKKKDKSYTFYLAPDLTTIRWEAEGGSSSKDPNKHKLMIAEVKEMRIGLHSPAFDTRKDLEPMEHLCFSIVYGGEYDTLSLIAANQSDFNDWTTGLAYLIPHGDKATRRPQITHKIQEAFVSADADQSGKLDSKEITTFLNDMNLGLDVRQLKMKIKQFFRDEIQEGDDGENELDLEQFSRLYATISERRELRAIMQQYEGESDSDILSAAAFHRFLDLEQGFDNITLKQCKNLIDKYEPDEEGRREGFFTLQGFSDFMLDPMNDIFNPEHDVIHQDMDQPLSSYFVSSSHNTYLMEGQLKGRSSVEAYKRALLKGCRCVELDCWDGDDGIPIIYHGHTLTTKILFADVVATIARYAFRTSSYPLVLSLENHCSVDQQRFMAECMKREFGVMLDVPEVDESKEFLPSPESLKNKILLKHRKLPPKDFVDGDDDDDEVSEDDEDDVREITEKGKKERKDSFKRDKKKKKKIKVARELSDLINYVQVKAFKSFEESRTNCKYYVIHSFSEGQIRKLAYSGDGRRIVDLNKRQFTRTYPAGYRVDSSNYNPQDAWNAGCHLIALNFQKAGLYMQMNEGKFRQNGRCGYILKPKLMRDPNAVFTPTMRGPLAGVAMQDVTIKVISGQQLPKVGGGRNKVVSPLVNIELFGLPCDTITWHTRPVNSNGFRPVWEETFHAEVAMPELALLRFSVVDTNFGANDFVGQFTLPLESLRQGYRHIQLENERSEPLTHATLFVKVTITEGGRSSEFLAKRLHLAKGTQKKRPFGKIELLALAQKHKQSQQTLETVGVFSLDAHFKAQLRNLQSAVDMRDQFLTAKEQFYDAARMPPHARIGKVTRRLRHIMEDASMKGSLSLGDGPFPGSKRLSQVGDAVDSSTTERAEVIVHHFNQLSLAAERLLASGEDLAERLYHCISDVAITTAFETHATRIMTFRRPVSSMMDAVTTRTSQASSVIGESSSNTEFPSDISSAPRADLTVHLDSTGIKQKKRARVRQGYNKNCNKIVEARVKLLEALDQAREFRHGISLILEGAVEDEQMRGRRETEVSILRGEGFADADRATLQTMSQQREAALSDEPNILVTGDAQKSPDTYKRTQLDGDADDEVNATATTQMSLYDDDDQPATPTFSPRLEHNSFPETRTASSPAAFGSLNGVGDGDMRKASSPPGLPKSTSTVEAIISMQDTESTSMTTTNGHEDRVHDSMDEMNGIGGPGDESTDLYGGRKWTSDATDTSEPSLSQKNLTDEEIAKLPIRERRKMYEERERAVQEEAAYNARLRRRSSAAAADQHAPGQRQSMLLRRTSSLMRSADSSNDAPRSSNTEEEMSEEEEGGRLEKKRKSVALLISRWQTSDDV